MSSSAAPSPVDDCTALTATTSTDASMASASRSSGTTSTVTPRSAWARNGNSSETNSGSGASPRAPSGIANATWGVSPHTAPAPLGWAKQGEQQRADPRLGREPPSTVGDPQRDLGDQPRHGRADHDLLD